MGGLSALIVSPCVAAPLAARAAATSARPATPCWAASRCSCIAMGMSVPLLLVGASAGALAAARRRLDGAGQALVRPAAARAWPSTSVQPVLPPLVAMLAWGVLLIVGGASLGAFEPVAAGAHVGVARMVKGFGLVLALLGVLQFVGICQRRARSRAAARASRAGARGRRRRRRPPPTPARISTASRASPSSTSACSPPAAR